LREAARTADAVSLNKRESKLMIDVYKAMLMQQEMKELTARRRN
jgi:hypothetical protein